MTLRKFIFHPMHPSERTDADLLDRIRVALQNMRFWEAKGDAKAAQAYREQLEELRAEGRRRGFPPGRMMEDPPRPAKRLPG